ncbi:hypothetical protein RQP53_01255 [Paucibacter sp. APW11]|uniref:Uncharacterized protein n=1 Tax=Roseateles aquae TaxID=3077235 RepID=A0ABU3P6J2_9BURK|nr:hypothetical protein [Paucibacter sp. APW11]MDT8997897.1 hypothetical protein [Paucibacter sp. APW11]
MTSIGDSKIVFRQEEAAMHQLDRAIALFINERDYLCALTLAGAADGILGEMLKTAGHPTALDDHVAQIRAAEPQGASEKQLKDEVFNFTRNLLKHKMKDRKVSDQAEFSVPLETQAIYMITRAIGNSVKLRHEFIGNRLLFAEWVYKHRPDLIGD